MSEVGHNSEGQLRSITERINRLEDEKKDALENIKDVYAEAKSNGSDVAALRAVVKRQRSDAQKLADHEAMVETYLASLGMI